MQQSIIHAQVLGVHLTGKMNIVGLWEIVKATAIKKGSVLESMCMKKSVALNPANIH